MFVSPQSAPYVGRASSKANEKRQDNASTLVRSTFRTYTMSADQARWRDKNSKKPGKIQSTTLALNRNGNLWEHGHIRNPEKDSELR